MMSVSVSNHGLAKAPDSRIPLDLQAVFLASNGGKDIEKVKAPKNAFKTFTSLFTSIRSVKKKGSYKRSNSLDTVQTATIEEVADFDGDDSKLLFTNGEPLSPQKHMEVLLEARGYSTAKRRSLQTDFFKKPTPYQLACYGVSMIKAIQQDKNEKHIQDCLMAGLSPNGCSIHGETLLHKACRLGEHRIVKVFLDHDVDIRVCDSYGRTPLHDTCWGARPSFQTFSLLVAKDPSLLFLTDSRGTSPLEYVKKDHYVFWLEYLDNIVDKYFPRSQAATINERNRDLGAPNSKVVSDPAKALPLKLAEMVANGRMTPKEAIIMTELDSEDEDDSSDYSDDDSSDYSDSSYDIDEDTSETEPDDDINSLLNNSILLKDLQKYCVVPV